MEFYLHLVGSLVGGIIGIIIGTVIYDYREEILSGMLFLLILIGYICLLFFVLVDGVFFNRYFAEKREAYIKKREAEEEAEFEKHEAEKKERCKKGIHDYFRVCCLLRRIEELEKQKVKKDI